MVKMAEKTVVVKNNAGIHCRPSSVIINATLDFPDHEFHISTANGDVTLDSIIALLSLGLAKGDQVTVNVTGPRAEEACDKLAQLFETEFDFPPQ